MENWLGKGAQGQAPAKMDICEDAEKPGGSKGSATDLGWDENPADVPGTTYTRIFFLILKYHVA